jgi:hypothetical protein
LNFRSPYTLDSNEPSREEEERDRHAVNFLILATNPRVLCISSKATEALESLGRKRRIETGYALGQDMAGTVRKMVLRLTTSVVFSGQATKDSGIPSTLPISAVPGGCVEPENPCFRLF